MTTKLPGMFTEVIEDVPSWEDARYFAAVLTRADDSPNGKYFAYHRTPGGSSGSTHATIAEAAAALEEKKEFYNKFWEEKYQHKLNGDRSENGAWCLRINGKHYMCKPGDKGNGFGGRTFRWQMLNELTSNQIGLKPQAFTYITNNMWHQGDIPPEWRDRLPDNAIWVENTSAVG